jgi:SAM-dependent methyltransferase
MNAPMIPVREKAAVSSQRLQRISDYYSAATKDYGVWSQDYHMHFGYWRWGLNPFRRERMLRELSLQVLKRLELNGKPPLAVADLGGGTGATARVMVEHWPNTHVDVVTLSPLQIEIGKELSRNVEHSSRIQWHCCDYEHSPLPSGRYDAICLIESSCYAHGPDKKDLFREILRLLKPGGVFVIVDAMLKKPIPATGIQHAWRRKMYRTWCDAWAVPELGQIDLLRDTVRSLGGQIDQVEDWSYRIAPSVAHAPFLVIYHWIAETIKARGLLATWRWRHLVASFLSPWIGLLERNFVYVAVSGRRLN